MAWPTPQQIEEATLALSTHDDLVYAFASAYGRVPLNQLELGNFQTMLDSTLATIGASVAPAVSIPEQYGTAYVTANRHMPNSTHTIAAWLGITDQDVARNRLSGDMSLVPPIGTGYAGNAVVVADPNAGKPVVKPGLDPMRLVTDHPLIAGLGALGIYLILSGTVKLK